MNSLVNGCISSTYAHTHTHTNEQYRIIICARSGKHQSIDDNNNPVSFDFVTSQISQSHTQCNIFDIFIAKFYFFWVAALTNKSISNENAIKKYAM